MLVFGKDSNTNNKWVRATKDHFLHSQEVILGRTEFLYTGQKVKGIFSAIFSSMLDSRDSITGGFIVGTFKYNYSKPIGSGDKLDPVHDESITVFYGDCKQKIFGAVLITFKLSGKTTGEIKFKKEEILMTQDEGETTTTQFCQDMKGKLK